MPDSIPEPFEAIEPVDAEGAPRKGMRWFFFGSDGLRAGWSLLLFLVLVAGISFATRTVVQHYYHPAKRAAEDHVMRARGTILGEGVSFAACAFAAWIMSRIERRSFGLYGLGGRRRIGDFVLGLAWGILAISLLVGSLWATHLLGFDGVALHGRLALIDGALWTVAFVLVGFFEEFLTRGYIQYTVARGVSGIARMVNPASEETHALGFWIAAFLFSALVFMGLHLANKGETAIGIVAVGVAGLTFAFSLWRTGTLWWAIGFHAAWDWGQSYLYGVADSGGMVEGHLLTTHPIGLPMLSGGTTGPEGSVFVIPTLALVCVVIHFTLPRREYPLTPDQTPAETLYTRA